MQNTEVVDLKPADPPPAKVFRIETPKLWSLLLTAAVAVLCLVATKVVNDQSNKPQAGNVNPPAPPVQRNDEVKPPKPPEPPPTEPAFVVVPFSENTTPATDLADPTTPTASVWATLTHLPPAERASHHAKLAAVPGAVRITDDVYRLPCSGKTAEALEAATQCYPYGLAPTNSSDPTGRAAYWKVVTTSSFTHPVVRGDWLVNRTATDPALAAAFGLKGTADEREQYLRRQVSEAELKAVGLSGAITVAQLEATTDGESRFQKAAKANGVGVPVK